jgi:mannose-6-phosphate isomerase-like protein (cupin superfamily)
MNKPMTKPLSLERFPLHLGLGACAVSQPEFTGMEWFAAYVERNAADGPDSRLVLLHSFSENWTSWERHPAGDEAVICIAGEITLIQEVADGTESVTLRAGDYAINPRGVWHTANIADNATALFITAGMGTEHRPR